MRLRQITEGRDAPLYHGTHMLALLLILDTDLLEAGHHWGREWEPDGPRLSRSFSTSKTFAHPRTKGVGGGIIELSQTKLAQNYRILPYRDSIIQDDEDEQEEVVVTPLIKPISRYLTGLFVNSKDIDRCVGNSELMEYWITDHGYFRTPQQIEAALQGLATHPLRRSYQ